MGKRIIKIIESHLEDSLRLALSIEDMRAENAITQEQTVNTVESHREISGFWGNTLGIIAFSFFIIIQLPFLPILIWPNLYRLYLRVVYKIPFAPFMCPGPCKEIDRINNKIKVEIRPNDHLPPHFHIIIDDESASFRITDCVLLNGNVRSKYVKGIEEWYKDNRTVLIKEWNITRPSDRHKDRIK